MSSLALHIHRQRRAQQLKLWSMKINPLDILQMIASKNSKTKTNISNVAATQIN